MPKWYAISELMDEIVAEVVAREEMVMYDDPSLNDIKKFTVEELYAKLDEELTHKISQSFGTDITLLRTSKSIFVYLSELYRRCVLWPEILDWWEYDIVRCDCYGYNCEVTALMDEVDLFPVNREMSPDEIRDASGCCIRCHTSKCGPLLSKEDSKLVHEQKMASKLHEILYHIKNYVKMELTKLRKIKALQLANLS
jgi:hypothetical protein